MQRSVCIQGRQDDEVLQEEDRRAAAGQVDVPGGDIRQHLHHRVRRLVLWSSALGGLQLRAPGEENSDCE